MLKLRSKKGFTLVEIMIVVAIIGLLAAIAIPNFIKARTQARKNICISNLRTLYHALEEYMIDTNTESGVSMSLTGTPIIGETSYVKTKPTCPGSGANYANTNTGSKPVCPSVVTYTDHVLP